MPDKTIFGIRLRTPKKDIIIPIIRMIFPNGSIFYKIIQNGSFWLVNVNNKWKLTGTKARGKQAFKNIVGRFRNTSEKRSS